MITRRNLISALVGVAVVPPLPAKPPLPKFNVNWTFGKSILKAPAIPN